LSKNTPTDCFFGDFAHWVNDIIQPKCTPDTRTVEYEELSNKTYVQYEGKCTEDYAKALHKYNAPCMYYCYGIKELKTVLSSLKSPVEKCLRSEVIYKLSCPHSARAMSRQRLDI